MRRHWTGMFVTLCTIAGARCALAENAPADVAPPDLNEVVVTATRIAQESLTLPMSVDRISRAEIHDGQSQVNLSESLETVPGVSVQSRQNYAQDLQISSRGFGARSAFGVRGVRLYSDGIPGTMPDGQGQFSQFDLGSADHIEVLRGPFSALYGNSSGGVIAVFTEDAPPGFELGSTLEYGSLNTQRYAALLGGDTGAVNYIMDVSHFQTDGYRRHSEAQRNLLNSKVRVKLDELSTLTFIANAIETPFVQDPLGLTAAQLAADPIQAGTGADMFNTRKSLAQEQLGVIYDRELNDNDSLVAMLYSGHRQTTQFQAIPLATQAVATSPGGVVDLARGYSGTDVHLSDHRDLWGTTLITTAGFSYDDLDEHRRGYLNYIGADLGVEGALRRYETNLVHDLDEYLQEQWDLTPHLHATAGIRNSVVDISDHSHLSVSGALPLSGTRYSATNPVAGLSYELTRDLSTYASFGRGFETPTLNELAYRSVTGNLPGLNFGLQPARSSDYEVGVKTRGANFRLDASLFFIRTENELGVLQSSGGRSVYENIGATQREGAELGVTADLPGNFETRLAYSYLKAVVEDAYAGCAGTPCAPDVIPAGSVLPAIPQNILYAGLTWRYPATGFFATAETLARSGIYADDRNTGYAGGYWTENLRAGFEHKSSGWQTSEFVRIENMFNKAYVGSVIVNDANSRFFEPAPGFSVFVMFEAKYLDPRG
ncbi:MAG TPA: TonB-dependent receptor [Steroidobacteraceae bacterium]|jgi:iron complex outermembrane receptor protein|nr:TonB-dependent receptor [Steroidobacteraceae bacterium]